MWIQRGGFRLKVVVNITLCFWPSRIQSPFLFWEKSLLWDTSWKLRSVFHYENQRGGRHFFSLLEARDTWPWLSHMPIINSHESFYLEGLAEWCSNLQQTIILIMYPTGAMRSVQWHNVNGCALPWLFLKLDLDCIPLFLAFFVSAQFPKTCFFSLPTDFWGLPYILHIILFLLHLAQVSFGGLQSIVMTETNIHLESSHIIKCCG